MENPIKMDDLGVPLFLETPIGPYGRFWSASYLRWILGVMIKPRHTWEWLASAKPSILSTWFFSTMLPLIIPEESSYFLLPSWELTYPIKNHF